MYIYWVGWVYLLCFVVFDSGEWGWCGDCCVVVGGRGIGW